MFLICAVVGILLGWFFGTSSNGMTSPRQAFNFWTVPTTAVVGLVLGAVVGLFAGAFLSFALSGLFGGAVGGFFGLAGARLKRGGW